MKEIRHRCQWIVTFFVLLNSGDLFGQVTDSYRQAADSYRALAARASGADQQCYLAFAAYYDSVVGELLGRGRSQPQPSCVPSGNTVTTGTINNRVGNSTFGNAGATPMDQSQQLILQGLGLFQQIVDDRRERKAQEEELKRLAAEERLQQEALERQQAIQRQIADQERKEQQLRDSACQLLIESRAMLGQHIDLAGDNACSRITNAILEDMSQYSRGGTGSGIVRQSEQQSAQQEAECDALIAAAAQAGRTVDLAGENACSRIVNGTLSQTIYRTIGGSRSGGTALQIDTILDGSKIPNKIEFPPGGLVDKVAEGDLKVGQLAPSGKPALDQLLDSIGSSTTNSMSGAGGAGENGPYPLELVDRLNQLLDGTIKK